MKAAFNSIGLFRRRRPLKTAAAAVLAVAAGLVLVQLVLAAPPTADFSISSATPLVGDTVTFTSTVTDPDDDVAEVAWDFDYDGTFAADATGAIVTHSYATAGARTVALRVTDGTGGNPADGQADVVLVTHGLTVVAPNVAPTAQFTTEHSVTPGLPDAGEPVTFDGGGSSDSDGTIATYEWDFDFVGNNFTVDATGARNSHPYASAGQRTVALRVTDNTGATDLEMHQVTVNAPPVARIVYEANPLSNPGQNRLVPLVGARVVFGGNRSTDAEGPISTFAWDLDDDNRFGEAGETGAAPTHNFPTAGDKRVRLRVTDADQSTNVATVIVRVNTPPTARFIVNKPTPVTNETISLFAGIEDPDPDNLQNPANGVITKWEWDLDYDGTTFTADKTGQNIQHSYATAGIKRVRLRVTDGAGATTELEQTIDVANTRPSADFDYAPTDPLPGQAVTFDSGRSTPTAGKQVTKVEWDFDYDQARQTFTPDVGGPPSTHRSVSHSFATAGQKTVAVRVTETDGGQDVELKTVTVNAPPEASFSISSATPFTGDAVTFSSTSKDPDGPLPSQAWDMDNDGRFDDAVGPVASRAFPGAGPQTVRLRVVDSKGASAVAVGRVDVRVRPIPPIPPPPPLRVLSADVDIQGTVTKKWTKITRLIVHAPVGARVGQRCKGRSCPKRLKKLRVKKKTLRLRAFERKLRPGVKIRIPVTMQGFIGTHTQFTIRRGKKPKRVERCLQPAAKRPSACPSL